MIQGFGIDLTEIARVKRAVEKTPSFVKRILTPPELEQLAKLGGQRRYEYIAGRWSLKEAFAKAWGTGIGREVGFQDIAIINNQSGRPIVVKSPFEGRVWASVSHTKDLVMTEIILERTSDQKND